MCLFVCGWVGAYDGREVGKGRHGLELFLVIILKYDKEWFGFSLLIFFFFF